MNKQIIKKCVSLLIIFSILLNIIPNFGLLNTNVQAAERSGLKMIVTPGVTEFEEKNGHKIFKLNVYLNNTDDIGSTLYLKYPADKMTPCDVDGNAIASATGSAGTSNVKKAVSLGEQMDYSDAGADFMIDTDKGEIYCAFQIKTGEITSEHLMCTITFEITDPNFKISDISGDDFVIDVANDDDGYYTTVGDYYADTDPEYFGLDGFDFEEAREVTAITISGLGVTKAYKEGDELDIANITVKKTYSSGEPLTEEKSLSEVLKDTTNYDVKINDTALTEHTTLKVGDVLKVTYKGADKSETLATAEANLNVTKKQVTGIEIRNLESSYKQGTEINLAENIYIIYDGDTDNAVKLTDNTKYLLESTGNTISDGKIKLTNAVTTTVTVTYKGDDAASASVTKTYTITVEEKVVESIEVTGPTTTVYKVGDTLDLTGLTVTATYDTKETVELEKGEYTTDIEEGSELTNVGINTITVKYSKNPAITDTFDIVVFPNKLVGTEGETLSSITVEEGFNWETEGSQIEVGANNYNLQFTNREKDITKELSVEVLGIPSNLTATYGDTLADVTLPGGSGFSWEDTSALVGNVGEQTHNITYPGYEGLQAKVDVSEKEITVTIGKESSVYGESIKGLSVNDLVSLKAGSTLATGDEISSLGITLSTVAGTEGNTDAGDYEISGSSTNSNYKITFEKGTYTITKATLKAEDFDKTIPENKEYDGSPITAASANVKSTVTGAGETVVIKYYKDGEVTGTTEAPSDYGTYTVKVNVTEGKNYFAADGTDGKPEIELGSFSITKKKLTIADIEFKEPDPNVYDGNRKDATVEIKSTVTGAGTITSIKYYKDGVETDPVDAGDYTVKITTTGATNYENVTDMEVGTFTIEKADPVYDLPRDLTATYGDDLSSVELPDEFTWEETGKVGDAGTRTHTVKYTPTNSNYKEKTGIEVSVEVSKANLKDSDFDLFGMPMGNTKEYDGNSVTVTSQIKDTVPGADDIRNNVTVTYYKTEDGSESAEAPSDCGTYEVKVSVAEGNNYNSVDKLKIGEFSITPAQLDTAEITVENPDPNVYDGTTKIPKIIIPDGAGTVKEVKYYKDGTDIEVSNPTDAGIYKVKITTENATNYANIEELTEVGVFEIEKAEIPVDKIEVTADAEKTYNGKPSTATATLKAEVPGATDVTIDITYVDESGAEVSNPTDAGTYKIKVSSSGGANYKSLAKTEKTETIVINKVKLSKDDIQCTLPENLVYDNTSKKATITIVKDLGEGINLTVSADDITIKYEELAGTTVEDPINAGTYTIKVTVKAGKNYEALEETEVKTYTVDKATLTKDDFTVSGIPDGGSKSYDGNAVTVEASQKSHITERLSTEVQYYLASDTDHALLGAPKEIGTYIVKLKVVEGTNYKAANIELGQFTITPKDFDPSKIKYTNTAEYDGTNKDEHTVNITIDGDSEAIIENVKFYKDGSPVNARNVGTYTVTADITTTESGKVTGYQIGTFTITEKEIEVTIQNAEIVYGEELTEVHASANTDLGEGDNLTDIITYELSAKTVGEQTIIGKVKDTETAKNYKVTFNNGTCTIKEREITITIGNESSVYGESIKDLSVEDLVSLKDGSTLATGDEISSLGITLSTVAGTEGNTDAGDYEISGSSTNENYKITFEKGTYTITKATLKESDFDRVIEDVTYGTPVTINPTYKNGITEDDAGEITVKYYKEDGSPVMNPTEVGKYIVKVSTTGGKNYFAADEIELGEFNITKSTEPPEITMNNSDDITYDGTEKEAELTIPDGTGKVTVKYYKKEDDGTETPLGASEKPTDAGTYIVKVETEGGDNYGPMSETKVGEFTIKPRPVTVTIEDKTSVYGDVLKELTSNVTLGNVIDTDNLGITLTKEEGTDVGEYAIKGTATNTNYTVAFIDGTYEITKRPITISIDNKESAIEDELVELTYSVTEGNAIGVDKVVELSTNANKGLVGTYDITVNSKNDNYNVTISNGDEKGTYTVKDKVKEIKLSQEEISASCGTTLEDLIDGITYQVVYVGKGDQTAKALDQSMISPYNPNITGEQILTVTYEDTDPNSATKGQTFEAKITVTLSDTLTSITVKTNDENVKYYEGQTFNKENMVVTANYAVATSKDVDSYKVYVIRDGAEVELTDETKLKTTDEKIIVKYTENGITVSSEEITIDVKEDEIINITFNFNGEDEYDYGDAIDLGTSTITKVWASGLTHENDTIPMTKEMLVNTEITTEPSSFDSMKVLGDKQIGVQYTESGKIIVAKNADKTNNTFTIKINDVVTGIKIENKENLQKEYDLNSSLNYNYKDTTNPVKVTVTYASGATKQINLSECNLTGFDLTDKSKIGATQTVTVTYEEQVDSFEVKVLDFIESIKVTKYQAIYDIGDKLNIQEVKAVMASGAENIITEYTTSGFDSTTPGTQTVTVTYEGKKAEITVTIRNKVSDMYIEKLPSQISSDGKIVDKTIKYGTDLSKNGGSIIVKDAVNPEGKEVPMTDPSVSFEGYNPNQVGTQTVTVRYTYEEITDEGEKVIKSKTATFNVEVEDYVKEIKVTPPTKTTYEYGESLQLNGATVSKVWASGKITDTTEISGNMISEYNSKQVGVQTINVNAFGEENVGSFTVTVVDSTIDIYMKKEPNKLTYIQGESLDVTGAVLTVVKSSGSKDILLPNPSVTVTGYNPNKIGTQIITVTYDGKQTQFVVTVEEAPKKPTTPSNPNNPTPTQPTNPTKPTQPTNPSTSGIVKYTVKFVDYDGTVLKTEEVESGKSATAPEIEKREGYKFKGWDRVFDEVNEDITVKAQYEEVERAKINENLTVEQDEELDLSDVTLEIFDEYGEKTDEIPVTEDMISGFDPDKVGTQIVTITYVGEDGYEYTTTMKIRVIKPTATLGVKDEAKDTEETEMPILPIVAGVGGFTGLLLILLALVTRKNVEIYALTEDKRTLVGKQKISKNETRIVLDEYEKQLENANIEIVLNKKITKKLDEEMVSVVFKGKKATYKVQYENNEEFTIKIKNAD